MDSTADWQANRENVRVKVVNWVVVAASVLVSACSGGGGGDQEETDPSILPRADVRSADMLYPYRADGQFVDVLKECASIETAEAGCTLQRLPLIGQTGALVSINDVMDRLLVTHDWMGQRFETLLTQAPSDLLRLFGSVTSISIGSTVRPSNYWTGTAAIRLDPEYLWMTLEEKATVSTTEDYRSGFGRELEFWSIRASRNGSRAAYPYYSLTSYDERPLADLIIPVYSLLYHELGHAVDYLPTDVLGLVNTSLKPSDAIRELESYRSSQLLNDVFPLRSQAMDYLALVQFRGFEATEEQKSFTPTDVGTFMADDGAMKYYSYHTEREDFANLLESSMMKKNFNVDLSIGFVEKPADEDNYRCSELTVGWGQYERLSDPQVWSRAKWTVDRVYNQSAENDEFFNTLIGMSSNMTVGLDWCQNRDGVTASGRSTSPLSSQIDDAAMRRQINYERRPHHH